MLSLKPLGSGDSCKEFRFLSSLPEHEDGFTNEWFAIDSEYFYKCVMATLMGRSQGKYLPEGAIPETYYFLWADGPSDIGGGVDAAVEFPLITGMFRLRHHLTPELERGAGHVGMFIQKEFRGKGLCSKGFSLLLEEARTIVREDELHLRCCPDNPAVRAVLLRNGSMIHLQDAEGLSARIALR